MLLRSVASSALGVLVAAMIAVNLAGFWRTGTLDATFAGQRCSALVTRAATPVGTAGLRAGDRVDFRALSPEQRMGFSDPFAGRMQGAAGERTTLPVLRDGRRVDLGVEFVPIPRTPLQIALDLIGLAAFSLTGAFVLWRGRSAAAFALGAFLLCFAAGGFAFDLTGFLPLGARAVFNVLAFALTAGAIYSGFVLNERLSQGILGERTLRIIMIVTSAYCIAYGLLVALSQMALPLTGCTLPLFNSYVLFFFAGALGVMAILGAAVVRSRFRDRRVAWVFWTTVVCLVPFIALRGVERVMGTRLLGDDWLRVVAEALPFILLPIGYAYAIMRYRVVDVGFVLNRALVFAVLSTALLGGVILVEAFAEKVALGKNASLALEIAVPLAMGLTFNALHKRLERMVDRLLFSAKHRADEALRHFAADCGFIEKPATLRERTVEIVCEQARSEAAALYERTATGYRLGVGAGSAAFAGDVDGDDAAFVRMRATAGPVELAELESALGSAGIAFPLAVGGRLSGALVCGARPNGEPYAPDETELLRFVAQSVAAALAAAYARERSRFVDDVADEKVSLEEAQARARELRASG